MEVWRLEEGKDVRREDIVGNGKSAMADAAGKLNVLGKDFRIVGNRMEKWMPI